MLAMPLRQCAVPLLALLGACAIPTRIVAPFDDAEVTFEQLADALADADVVVLGEEHDSAPVHAAHLRILRDLYDRRPDLIVSMEMFERDVQPVLWQYLLGDIGESEFLAKARPWKDYSTAHRPVVEFARAHHIEVVAANVPRELARKVSEQGIGALPQSPFVARTTSAPEDDYWIAFKVQMAGHVGAAGEDKLRRFYEAQCLKDDTMAEAIADRLERAHNDGRRPLLVHFCGHFHSDHRRGTVQRLLARSPELRVQVLGVENVAPEYAGTTTASRTLADYVLLVPAVAEPEAAADPEPMQPLATDRSAQPRDRDDSDEGDRPGLGFMPDYGADVEGCAIAELAPGGAAEAAGLRAGDVIVRLGQFDVADVGSYAAALSELEVGQRIEVSVRRGADLLQLPVVVGRRSR